MMKYILPRYVRLGLHSKKYSLVSKHCMQEGKTQDINKDSVEEIEGITKENWNRVHSIFSNYGFKRNEILELVKYDKSIFNYSTTTLGHNLEFWRNFQFNERNFHELILQHPQLLNITNNHKTVANQVFLLKQYVQTSKNVWRLIFNSPKILSYKDYVISDYFKYLEKQMHLQIPEIVKSCVFSKSISTLKCRHIFLERLGIFKPIVDSKLNDFTNNPRLHKIIDTTDKEFCSKICGVSLIEFESFMELLRKEENEEN